MQFILMRHGIAIDRDDPASPDEAERYLTEEGIKKTRAAAKGLRKLDFAFDAWISSPFVRAMQTAEITAEVFGVAKTQIKQHKALLPSAHPLEIFKYFGSLHLDSVVAFGHAPNVDEVIAMAVGSKVPVTEMKKAGVAWLEMKSLSPPRGEIIALFTPKALRLMGD